MCGEGVILSSGPQPTTPQAAPPPQPPTGRCLHTRADTHTENVLGAPLRSCYSVTHWVFTQVTSPAPRRVQQLTWAP